MVDEQYYPNPEKFNPDNFSPDKKTERSPYTFLAFGQGPRNCIGMRFALLQVKTAIARMVFNYRFENFRLDQKEVYFIIIEC